MSGHAATQARLRSAVEHAYCRRLLENQFARGRGGPPSEREVFAFAREYRKVRRGEALAELRERLTRATFPETSHG